MYSEYNVGNDYREFARNKDVDESKIKVTLLNGVLELELPKRSRRGPGK
jgi:HSP20 family molecular chaperone IbpA